MALESNADRRTGLIFLGAPSVPELVELAREAEARGFDSIWMAETRITRDAIVPLTAIAAATDRVRVGTGIINVYTRGPVLIAITFIGLDEIAPGRVVMGLGTGSPLVLAPQGVPFERPLTRLREYCEVMRPLMRGETVSYDGETVRLDGARIEDLLSEADAAASPARAIPLYLGVTGPKALELSGELADGVLLNVCLPVSYVERAMELIERGARRSGRTVEDLEVGMMFATSPHPDSAEGKERARRFAALYLSMFPNIARETGLDEELLAGTRAAFDEKGLDVAARHIGDDVVDLLTIAGTPDECRARLAAYREAGVALPILFPVPGAMELTIETLAS